MKNAADTLSWHFLKGLLSRYCVRARKGTPDIHRSGPSVRAGMTGRSGSPHPPREPCCHMVNPFISHANALCSFSEKYICINSSL